jgi:hypothetical protein
MLTQAAEAQKLSINATVRSFHLDRDAGFNENNPGLGVGLKLSSNLTLETGFYYNSNSWTSTYAAVAAMWPEGGWVKMGGFVGVVTGYPDYAVLPAGAPAVSVGRRVSLRISFIPVDSGVFASQISIKLYDRDAE